jgi:hypothetical protein
MDGSHLGLGQIINKHQERDAIHIAVVPVMADEMLRPGQKVVATNYMGDGGRIVRKLTGEEHNIHIGVIDPFLTVPVLRGQRCWLYLNPGSITSLRHDWTHPSI